MDPLAQLIEAVGNYEGTGTNHDKESFTGTLSLQPIIDGQGVEITYHAVGEDGTSYHKEKSIIARDFAGNLKMWNLNSNSPGMAELKCQIKGERLTFLMGDLDNADEFREEIAIELLDHALGYHYSWGLPGGEFAYRSGLVMTLLDN